MMMNVTEENTEKKECKNTATLNRKLRIRNKNTVISERGQSVTENYGNHKQPCVYNLAQSIEKICSVH
jgi:hypothetical protein